MVVSMILHTRNIILDRSFQNSRNSVVALLLHPTEADNSLSCVIGPEMTA